MGNIKVQKFFLFSIIGALCWASLASAAGCFFGALIESQFSELKHYEEEVLGTMIAIAILIAVFRRARK